MREEVGKTMYHSLEGWQVSGDQFKWLFNSSHLGFTPELIRSGPKMKALGRDFTKQNVSTC